MNCCEIKYEILQAKILRNPELEICKDCLIELLEGIQKRMKDDNETIIILSTKYDRMMLQNIQKERRQEYGC